MKKIIFLFSFSIFTNFTHPNPPVTSCDVTYSQATYALVHTKKALTANNFEHQKYYAERAIESFKQVQKSVADCGCNQSLALILKGIGNLELAVDPKDWDLGRHYAKKAYANAQDVISALDLCSSNNPVADKGTETNDGVSKNSLAEQLALKKEAEQSLSEFKLTVRKLASSLGCDNAIAIINAETIGTDENLKNETLEATREYYLNQTISIQDTVLEALKNCSSTGK